MREQQRQTTISEEQLEPIGELADRIDNLAAALNLPMPDSFHVKQLKSELPKVANELKRFYRSISGENPWDGGPFDIK